jgi:hypothetical protein
VDLKRDALILLAGRVCAAHSVSSLGWRLTRNSETALDSTQPSPRWTQGAGIWELRRLDALFGNDFLLPPDRPGTLASKSPEAPRTVLNLVLVYTERRKLTPNR